MNWITAQLTGKTVEHDEKMLITVQLSDRIELAVQPMDRTDAVWITHSNKSYKKLQQKDSQVKITSKKIIYNVNFFDCLQVYTISS